MFLRQQSHPTRVLFVPAQFGMEFWVETRAIWVLRRGPGTRVLHRVQTCAWPWRDGVWTPMAHTGVVKDSSSAGRFLGIASLSVRRWRRCSGGGGGRRCGSRDHGCFRTLRREAFDVGWCYQHRVICDDADPPVVTNDDRSVERV